MVGACNQLVLGQKRPGYVSAAMIESLIESQQTGWVDMIMTRLQAVEMHNDHLRQTVESLQEQLLSPELPAGFSSGQSCRSLVACGPSAGIVFRVMVRCRRVDTFEGVMRGLGAAFPDCTGIAAFFDGDW